MSAYKPMILIVDDEQKNIQVLGTVLIGAGYNVVTAVNGHQALEKLGKIHPDIILMDIMMPVMDGIQTCEKIKSDEKLKSIPVIFLTAKVEKEDIVEGFRKGAVDYITKPFNHEELLCRVATHVELVLNRRRLAEHAHSTSELLHILCHDIVNPIGSISNILSLVDENEPIEVYRGLLQSSVERCLNVIDLVRQMRAVEEGKLQIVTEPNDLLELVNTSVEILAGKLNKKRTAVKIDIPAGTKVMTERVSFVNSVMSNLITNAIKFSEKDSKIYVTAEEDGEYVIISVKDFGIGMPDRLVKNVFDPAKVTTRKGTDGEAGTGFGLPLVKKFIDVYGGEIEVLSVEKTPDSTENGTIVRVKLLRG